MVRDWRQAPLTDADRALCGFAVKLTAHQRDMSPGDLEELRSHGFDDRAILDAVQVTGFFNYITKLADGLGVELESFVRPWGGSQP